mgnify:CR=1 FL=1
MKAWWEHLDLIGDCAYLTILLCSVIGAVVVTYRIVTQWRLGWMLW